MTTESTVAPNLVVTSLPSSDPRMIRSFTKSHILECNTVLCDTDKLTNIIESYPYQKIESEARTLEVTLVDLEFKPNVKLSTNNINEIDPSSISLRVEAGTWWKLMSKQSICWGLKARQENHWYSSRS